jgi:hypothetical protein
MWIADCLTTSITQSVNTYDYMLALSLSVGATVHEIPWPLFVQFLEHTQMLGLIGWGISPPQGRCLHTGQHKRRINTDKHPCRVWDSNPLPKCVSGRRQLCLRPRNHCDRHIHTLRGIKVTFLETAKCSTVVIFTST